MENTTNTTEKKGNIEDLVAWQKAKELATNAYKILNVSNIDAILKEKMLKSALEVPYSVARSYGVKQRVQSLENLYEARECIFEFKTALAISSDLGMLSEQQVSELNPLLDHTDKLISGLIQYKEDARKGKLRNNGNKPHHQRREVDGNNANSDNFGNSVDYASSPISNF